MLKENHQKIILGLSLFLFLAGKFSLLTFRFGDSNAYFYMADQFWQGVLPYRDYFLADPPMIVWTLSFFKLWIGENLILLQAVPFLLDAASAWLIFRISQKNHCPLAFLAPALFLFSFSILATSDFVTGVQLVNFFSLAGIYFFQQDRFKTSGFFWGLAVLSKLYAVFLLAGFLAALVFQKKFHPIFWLSLGGILAGIIFLAPFFWMAPQAAFDALITHHFHRPSGGNKWAVWIFFLKKEWLGLGLIIISAVKFRRPLFFLPPFFLLVFLLFFQDLYYTYFAALIPWLVLSAIALVGDWFSNPKTKDFLPVLGIVWLILALFGAKQYQTRHLPLGQFSNSRPIADFIRSKDDSRPLYGSHEVAPLVALLAQRKLLGNYIDTNPQTFGSQIHDKEKISAEVVEKKAYLIARIARREEYGPEDVGTEGYLNWKKIKDRCPQAAQFPSSSQEWDNLIVVYDCSQ